MSEASADTPKVGIVRVALGLCALGGIVGLVASQRSGTIDGRAVFAEAFEERALPFGLELESAMLLGDQRRLLVFADPRAEPEAPAAVPPPPPKEGDEPRAPFDASKVTIGPADQPPRRVELVFHPKGSGLAGVRAEFERGGWRDTRSIGHEGGTAALDLLRLPWQGYDAVCVHERKFEPGGTFVDSMRVNLSTPGRPCVLRAIWSRGLPASKERLTELLDGLRIAAAAAAPPAIPAGN